MAPEWYRSSRLPLQLSSDLADTLVFRLIVVETGVKACPWRDICFSDLASMSHSAFPFFPCACGASIALGGSRTDHQSQDSSMRTSCLISCILGAEIGQEATSRNVGPTARTAAAEPDSNTLHATPSSRVSPCLGDQHAQRDSIRVYWTGTASTECKMGSSAHYQRCSGGQEVSCPKQIRSR